MSDKKCKWCRHWDFDFNENQERIVERCRKHPNKLDLVPCENYQREVGSDDDREI